MRLKLYFRSSFRASLDLIYLGGQKGSTFSHGEGCETSGKFPGNAYFTDH